MAEQFSKRDHALAMGSAAHLRRMGHITQDHHDAICEHCTSAMRAASSPEHARAPKAPAFGSLRGAGHYEGDEGGGP